MNRLSEGHWKCEAGMRIWGADVNCELQISNITELEACDL